MPVTPKPPRSAAVTGRVAPRVPAETQVPAPQATTGGTGANAPEPGVPQADLKVTGAVLQDLQTLGAPSVEAVRASFADVLGTLGAHSAQPAAQPVAGLTPSRPRIEALYQDPAFKGLYEFVMDTRAVVEREHREWDKLAQIKAFTAAVDFVVKNAALPGARAEAGAFDKPLAQRFPDAQAQRAICHLLLLLMPHEDRTERPMMPDGSRAAPQDLFRPFPDAVLARADDGFAMKRGDLPRVNPIFTQHLTRPDLLDAVFRPGQQGLFLASKKFCPGAFVQDRADKNPRTLDKKLQSGHQGDPIMVRIDDVVVKDGVKMARVHVPAQHKVWLDGGGACARGDEVLPRIDTVLDKKGQPVLGADGQPQPIWIPVEHLAQYLLAEGDGARTLNLSREEDRAIALCYAETLKQTTLTDSNGYTKTLFDWLEQADHRTPRHDVDRIKEAVRQAAFQSVVRYSTHPRRTHFKLDVDPKELAAVRAGKKPAGEADWQVQAFLALEETGIMRDQGNYYEKDKASTAHVHEMAWTAQFLKNGFIGGSLDCLGSSDAFDKLSKTFLEPLGIVSTTGIAEGHGAALMRVLSQPDDHGVIHVGTPMKVKANELIVGLEMPLSSGRGPAAQYMENWGGYLRIDGPIGKAVSFKTALGKHDALVAKVDA